MKILIDLSYIQNEKSFSGIYEYGGKIFESLVKDGRSNISVILIKKFDVQQEIKKIIDTNNIKIEYIENEKNTKKYWKELENLFNLDYDIIYFPYQLDRYKFKINSKTKLMFTIHDLTQLEMSKPSKINKYERLYTRNYKETIKVFVKKVLRVTRFWYRKMFKTLKSNIESAEHIFCVSDYTRKTVVDTFKTNVDNITACYTPLKIAPQKFESNLVDKDYILLVSANRYSKNTDRAIKVLDRLYDNGFQYKTIILGNAPDKVKNIARNKQMFDFFGYVSSDDLEYYYKNAKLFLFPSLCEGFGLPPVEAMKYSTNCCISNATCLSEIYEGLVMFNPYDLDDMQEKILYSLDNYNKELIDSIVQRIIKTQDEHLKIMLDIINRGE